MFVIYNPNNLEEVTILHDESIVTEEMEAKGFYIDTLPQHQEGKDMTYIADPVNKQVTARYVPKIMSERERITELENTVAILMLGGGGLV